MTVTSNRFSRRDSDLTRREIVTPEGVPLVFYIARAGDRLSAFLLDLLFMVLLILGVWLVAFLAAVATGSEDAGSIGLLGFFLIRNGYFLFFETRSQGRTPGKRKFEIRVIDARGGMLRMDQLIVRNLMREMEWFYPLIILANPEVIADAGPGGLRVISVVWFGIIMLFPLFNRERRRVGDLLAGTMVVSESRARLREDLGRDTAKKKKKKVTGAFAFTAEQLQMYGVYELQVLEELLRDQAGDARTLRVVAGKIQKKIGWQKKIKNPHEFLTAFYDAQRARLEHDLLLGRARETKHDKKNS
jgi:uncharacterized RDD family membrane protein YckC